MHISNQLHLDIVIVKLEWYLLGGVWSISLTLGLDNIHGCQIILRIRNF